MHTIFPHLPFFPPTMISGGLLYLAACLNSGSVYSTSIRSPSLFGSVLSKNSVRYLCTMLSAGEWMLNSGMPRSLAASAPWL